MIPYKNRNDIIKIADGLKSSDGTSYQPYISKTEEADTVVDFSDNVNNKILKYFPQNAGVQSSKETLSIETIGAKTAVKIAGSETYSGSITWGGFTDSLPYITSLAMRASKSQITNGIILGFMYGNGVFSLQKSVEALTNDVKFLGIYGGELKKDFNYASFRVDTEDLESEPVCNALYFSDDRYLMSETFAGITNIKPKIASGTQEIFAYNNFYFADKVAYKSNVKIKTQDVCSLTADDKGFNKEGTADITATLNIANGYAYITLKGGDIANITEVELSSGTLNLKGYLYKDAYGTHIYLSWDIFITNVINANGLTITLTGTDIVLKNKAKWTFTDNKKYTVMKIVEVNKNKGTTGEGILWTTKDSNSSNVILSSNELKWSEFKEVFDNLKGTQTFAPYMDDDCTCFLSSIVTDSQTYEITGTGLMICIGTENMANKYGKYFYLYVPETQEAITFNMLLQDTSKKNANVNAVKGIQYVGCEAKSLSFSFANKGLTQLTSNVTALKKVDSTLSINDVKTNKVENRSSALVQSSNEPTKVMINCLETKSIQDLTFNFEWTKEDTYNIEAEKFIKDNSKYTWSFGGNAMYNDVTKDFMDRLNSGDNLSIILQAQRTLNNKVNQLFICSLKATGVVSDPTIQTGDLTVALSDITGDEVTLYDSFNSNFIMIFSDDELLASEIQN